MTSRGRFLPKPHDRSKSRVLVLVARWVRAAAVVCVTLAVVAGVMSSPPVTPLAAAAEPGAPGAPGFLPPAPADIFRPLEMINRIVSGGGSTGPWGRDSSQGLPSDQPVDPSAQAPKPGLGTQDFYPIERRALGDRMELLVNLANGNVVVRNTDLVFGGTGLNTAVNHFYNNLATNRGSFGQRWTMSTGRDVGLEVRPDRVVLQGPSGYRQDYIANGDGFSSPPGADATLTRRDGGYQLEFKGSKEKWRFDAGGFFTSQVDRNDNTIRYAYNADGTLASITDTRGAVTSFDHDLAGRVRTMTDPAGFSYGPYEYDLMGRHTGFTDPTGDRVTYRYDDAGNLTEITDPNGGTYRLEYDGQRRVTSVSEPREGGVLAGDRAVTRYEYVSATETRGTAPNGGTTTYTFDGDGKQTEARDPLGREEGKTYTANFDVNTTTSVGGNVSTASYDPNNNLIGTRLPTGAQNAVGYTDAANPNAPTSATDSEGRQTTMTYDNEGNPLTVKQAQTGQGIERQYNDNGTVRESRDGNGNVTRYTYDPEGRLITVTPPGPRAAVRYTYDSRSRITSVTDGNGIVIEYSYDAEDRVTELAQRTGATRRVIQQTDFDPNGNKIANYFATTTTQFTYSPRNQVLTATRRGGVLVPADVVTYTYDATNNLASLRDAGGTTRYRYDQANDLTELTDLAGGVTRYSYDDDGNRTTTAYPNRTRQVREVDDSGRVTRITGSVPNEINLVRTYNYRGARGDTELLQSAGVPTTSASGSTTRYTYDGSSRLTRARNTNNGNGSVNNDYSFGYDRAGNITSLSGTAFTRNVANQLTRAGSTTVTHDRQGNMTGTSAGGSTTYTPTNQQDTRAAPDITFRAGYDTADTTQLQRIDDRLPNGARFSYEFTQSALGITGRVRAGQGRYSISRDPDGAPVVQRNPDGSLHYFELDRQGSVIGHSRSDGSRTAGFNYTPYGTYDYVGGLDSGNGDNFLGFQGGFFHSTPANTKFGHRWYDARLGQFTQPDPIGTPGSSGSGQDNRSGIGGPYSTEANAYNFAANNPCNNTDPTGLLPEGCALGIVGYVGALVGFAVAVGNVPKELGKVRSRRSAFVQGAKAAGPVVVATAAGAVAAGNAVVKCAPAALE